MKLYYVIQLLYCIPGGVVKPSNGTKTTINQQLDLYELLSYLRLRTPFDHQGKPGAPKAKNKRSKILA